MRYVILTALLCLFLASCGTPPGDSPAAQQTKQAAGNLAATAFAPTMPASAKPQQQSAATSKVGGTASVASYTLTLHGIEYPSSTTAPAGQRLISMDMTITAKVIDMPYNPIYAKVKMADNTEGSLWLLGTDSLLQAGKLTNGESVRGRVVFAFPASAQPATFVYEPMTPSGGESRVTFDLR